MKEQWRKEMQQKLAGYRQPAPEVSWPEIEHAVTQQGAHAQVNRPLWHKIAAAAMIAGAVGGGYIAFQHRAEAPGTPTAAAIKPAQKIQPAATSFPSVAPATPAMPVINPPRYAQTIVAHAQEDYPASNNTATEPDLSANAPLQQPQSVPDQPATRPRRKVPNIATTPKKEANTRLMASAFMSNVATAQNNFSTDVPMLAAADPIGMHEKDMNGKGSYAMINRENDMHTSVHHRQPVRFGLSLRYNLNPRWSIEAGISYTRLTSDISRKTDAYAYETKQKLSYVGIPLNVNYRLWNNRRINLYASAGGTVEKMVKGKATNNTIVNDKISNTTTESLHIDQPQFSANAAIGAELKLDNRFNIYAEPGLSYYFDNKSSVPTIYQDKPLNFNLNIGIRINIK